MITENSTPWHMALCAAKMADGDFRLMTYSTGVKTLTTLEFEYFIYNNYLQTILFTSYKYNTTKNKSVHLSGPIMGLVRNLYPIRGWFTNQLQIDADAIHGAAA